MREAVSSWEHSEQQPPDANGLAASGRAGGPSSASPSHPRTAAEFTLQADLLPRHGLRELLDVLTGRRTREQRERALHAAVMTAVSRQIRILVACCKGGVGKTTLTLLLGHVLARLRGDHVVALDLNPDIGSLGARIPRQTNRTIVDLLRDIDAIDSYATLRAYTSQASSRLEVLASNSDPHASRALTGADYQRVIRLLARYYNIILMDAGTGVLDSATQGGLEVADQLVVPLSPSRDETHVAASTLDWLEANGHAHLVQGAVAVINQASEGDDRIQEHFADRCAAVVRIPWDPVLARGGDTAIELLAPSTQSACLELAAAVGARFNQPLASPLQEHP